MLVPCLLSLMDLNETSLEFRAFPKMARLGRPIIITEKIDGTNAQIVITDDGQMFTGSRNRWITPEDDNYGFARWAQEHSDELLTLGPGRHFGEWWGQGIQRNYGLDGKRFSLFNVVQFCLHNEAPLELTQRDPKAQSKFQIRLPACVGLVPVLYRGSFCMEAVDITLARLVDFGSSAVEGFMNPEGVVVWHTAAQVAFKKTINDDSEGKWNTPA